MVIWRVGELSRLGRCMSLELLIEIVDPGMLRKCTNPPASTGKATSILCLLSRAKILEWIVCVSHEELRGNL